MIDLSRFSTVCPSRDHVFVMQFKQLWSVSKIHDYFSAFGKFIKKMFFYDSTHIHTISRSNAVFTYIQGGARLVSIDEASYYIVLSEEKQSVNGNIITCCS